MNIALTGSTGKVGAAVLAAAPNLRIRPLARRPEPGAVRFDFADPATYAPALDGVEVLVLISPAAHGQQSLDLAFVDAARKAGVSHVVKLSGEGAGEAATRFGAHHRAVEDHIQKSGLAWTFVRPTFFMENILMLSAAIAGGTYPSPTADARMTQVAVADIAAVLAAVASAPAPHRGATYTLTGPVASTGEEIASILSAASGHPVRYVDVPEGTFHENLLRAGVDAWSAEGVVEAFRKVRAGASSKVTDDVRRLLGRAPIDFAMWSKGRF